MSILPIGVLATWKISPDGRLLSRKQDALRAETVRQVQHQAFSRQHTATSHGIEHDIAIDDRQ